jgi:hypothetical protein
MKSGSLFPAWFDNREFLDFRASGTDNVEARELLAVLFQHESLRSWDCKGEWKQCEFWLVSLIGIYLPYQMVRQSLT